MQSTLWKKEEVIEENPNPVPQQPLVIEHTLTDVDHPHLKSNEIHSIDPVVTDLNSLTFTVAGKYTTARLDVDSNACTDVVTDWEKYGCISVMKRMPLLDVVFTGVDSSSKSNQEVRILIGNQLVHILQNKFNSL